MAPLDCGYIPIMSFDLAVWDSDIAVTNEEADEIYAKLCEGQALPGDASPAIEAFYSELTARWPEIDALAKEDLDDLGLCPWSCALYRSGGYVVMSCVWSRAEKVRAVVESLAKKHRLVQFNPQTGEVSLPSHLSSD
jgi:hypothetical protein